MSGSPAPGPRIRTVRSSPAPAAAPELGAEPLIRRLGAVSPEARARECHALAEALVSAGSPAEAHAFALRAFQLSGGARWSVPLLERLLIGQGDASALRRVRKQVGLAAAAAGDASQALADFNAWHYTDAALRGQDRYELDPEVLAAVRRLAEPLRLPPRPLAPPQGRRLRVAHLLFGMAHQNSVIVRISRLFARHHDRERFEAIFFSPESQRELAASSQGLGHVADLRQQGWEVQAAPDEGSPAERMAAVARAIHASGADLLVMNAALADFHHHFVLAMAPAPASIGFVSGPPAQFAAPELDHGISWTWHTLMDAPIPCSRVELETDLPDPAAVALRSRARLGMPEEAVVIGAAGRPGKHRSPELWGLVLELLRRHPSAHFLCVGATQAQLPEIAPLPCELAGRVHFAPWMDGYLEVFGLSDLVLDTYPSGGGVALTDVMALGRPVVAFENDYRRPYDQADWNPAHEFLPAGELVVPRGDGQRFLEVVGRLVEDPAHRRAMGLRCQAAVRAGRGSPERMVRRCEALFEQVIAEKARSRT